jgi:hypothetical protein
MLLFWGAQEVRHAILEHVIWEHVIVEPHQVAPFLGGSGGEACDSGARSLPPS